MSQTSVERAFGELKFLDSLLDEDGKQLWLPLSYKGRTFTEYRLSMYPQPHRLDFYSAKTGKYTSGSRNQSGYDIIHWMEDRQLYRCRVHILRWTMFKGPIPENMSIDHINGIRSDNSLSNLRLALPVDQITNRGHFRRLDREVPIIDDLGRKYKSLTEAASALGCSPCWISDGLRKGKRVKGRLFTIDPLEDNVGETWIPLGSRKRYFFSSMTGLLSQLKKYQGQEYRVPVTLTQTEGVYKRIVTPNGTLEALHRLIFKALHGKDSIPPGHQIDHIDSNIHNNAPSNLQVLSTLEHHRKTFGRRVELYSGETVYKSVDDIALEFKLSYGNASQLSGKVEHEKIKFIHAPVQRKHNTTNMSVNQARLQRSGAQGHVVSVVQKGPLDVDGKSFKTVREAAKYADVHEATMYKWIKGGNKRVRLFDDMPEEERDEKRRKLESQSFSSAMETANESAAEPICETGMSRTKLQ